MSHLCPFRELLVLILLANSLALTYKLLDLLFLCYNNLVKREFSPMTKKIIKNNKKPISLTNKAKGKISRKKSMIYNRRIVKRLGQKNKQNQTISAEFISLQSKQAINQTTLELDSFLVDEQIVYSSRVEETIIKPALSELDKVIIGKREVANFTDLLPRPEIKITLGKNGEVVAKHQSHAVTNSAYLLDLKKKQEDYYKLERPPKSTFEKFFSVTKAPFISKVIKPETGDNNVREVAPSLLNSKRLIDRLDEWGTEVYQFIVKLWPRQKRISSISPPPSAKLIRANFWLANFKLALNFALVALLLILPIRGLFFYQSLVKTKGQVLGVSEGAIAELKRGAKAMNDWDWQQASSNFSSANNYFDEAQNFISQYNQTFWDLLKFLPAAGKKFETSENLLLAGKYLTSVAENLAKILQKTQTKGNFEQTIAYNLPVLRTDLTAVIDKMEKASLPLSQVEVEAIPPEYRDYFIQLKLKLPELTNNLKKAQEILSFILKLGGNDSPKRYLLMFQNPYEIRPAGGFFGSYAILDLKKGKITNLEIPGGGTYDLKGSFTKKVISPEPLHLIGSAWSFWDANWWPDFPTTAKKEMWFLENAGGPTVDGVIALNATLIPDILKIVGNIELAKYNKIFTPEEVVLALQHATLFEYDKKANQPKAIIADLAPELIKRLLSVKIEQALPLLSVLNKALGEKEIQFYFIDEKMQEQTAHFGWTGELLHTNKDYLLVVDANIAGGKTNAYLEQQINHYVYLQDDQSIVDTVSIVRKHNGNLIDPKDANYVFAKENNVSFIKIYVPKGAELLEVTGYNPPDPKLFKEVYSGFTEDEYLAQVQGEVKIDPKTGTYIYPNELGKTVFGNWIQVKPGEEATITFSYRLPKFPRPKSVLDKIYLALGKKATIDYSLLVQRQSGAFNLTFKSYLFYPANFRVKWSNSSTSGSLKPTERGLTYSSDLMSDQSYAVILQKLKK